MSDMRFDRRRLLAAGGSGVLATLLAACGSSGSSSGGGSAAAGATRLNPATEQGAVTVFDWAGYEIPVFWNQYKKGPYGKSNPLKFNFLENDQQALAKVAAGYTPDMAHPCIAYAKDWADAGLIQPWDTKLLPEYTDLRPNMRAAGMVDGKPYAIPWDWGFSSIAYRADRVKPEELSWNLYLDDRYKGRMSLYNDGVAVIKIGGLINGVKDPNKMTQAEIDAAKQTMIKAAGNLRNFWGSEPDTINDFVNGNIDITYAWPGTWYQIKNSPKMKGVPVEYLKPKEGRLAWICSYVLIKDTPRAGLAHEVMKAGLSVPAMSALINQYLYGASNASPAVISHVQDQTLVKAFGLDDPHSLDPPGVWLEHYLPNRVDYVKAFQEVQAAAGA